MHAGIAAIEYYLPERTLTTEDLVRECPEWSVEAIDAKTGIHVRHIASEDECASDLAVGAIRKLFESSACVPKEIDFLLLCTQSPDFALPTTACLLQDRLSMPRAMGALDFNLGCSGFVYGLGLSEGLIASGQATTILLVTADTYSKYIDPKDKATRTIFGDGAAATLIRAQDHATPSFGPFVFGTDGRGGMDLVVPNSGARLTSTLASAGPSKQTNPPQRNVLHMNGSKVFNFAINTVQASVSELLSKAGLDLGQVDLFIFHQANAYLLEEIRVSLQIPVEKFVVTMRDTANTVSSTIPIALKEAENNHLLNEGSTVMLVGFGVGFSWAATLVRWSRPTRTLPPFGSSQGVI
jgi:3-oxoacyl-[acyl-carrier-protein] synthase-3